MTAIIINALIPTATTILSAIASWALLSVRKYVAKKTTNEAINAAMIRITETTQTVVDDIAQTMAQALKAKNDGKLSEAQARTLKDMATKRIMSQLSHETVATASQAVTSVNGLVMAKVEQAVTRNKALGPFQYLEIGEAVTAEDGRQVQ